jgi:hypothetical protein
MFMFALPLQVDGRPGIDLVVGSKGAQAAIGWLKAPADARNVEAWTWHHLRDAGWVMSLEAHDMDADGDLDILASDRKQARRGVFWLENPGAEATRKNAAWREHDVGGREHEVMFLACGKSGTAGIDTIACAVSRGPILLFRKGRMTWSTEEIPLPSDSGTGKGVGLGDLDDDGDDDLAFTCENAKGELAGVGWLECIGETRKLRWHPHPISGAPGVKFDRLELLDLDGDGDLDLLTCEETENLGVIWYENPKR